MLNLSAKELKIFNNLSNVQSPSVNLGNRIQEIITGIPSIDGTPVNAVKATGTLSVTGVVVDGETATINNPLVAGTNVYEFVTDAAKTLTAPTNIAVDIAANATKASGTLTVAVQPIAGDTMWIGTKIYTFVANGTEAVEGDVSVGTDLATAKLAIVAAINGTDTINNPSDEVTAAAFQANVCTLTALIGGVIGNAIPTTETFDNVGNVFGAGTLATGADCTAANAIIALAAAIVANDTQGVTAVDGAGDTLVVTADVAGIIANDITTTEVMANATFGHEHLLGGVDGTVAPLGTMMVDDTYLYTAINTNTVSGANWRRIAVGAVY